MHSRVVDSDYVDRLVGRVVNELHSNACDCADAMFEIDVLLEYLGSSHKAKTLIDKPRKKDVEFSEQM